MKMQKSTIFAQKKLKTDIWKTKNIVKLESLLLYRGYRGGVHRICDWKYSVPKKILIAFHNGSKIIILS